MSWLLKISMVQIDWGQYPSRVREYLYGLVERDAIRQREIATYEPNFDTIASELTALGVHFSLDDLRSGEWSRIHTIYRALLEVSMSLPVGDPRYSRIGVVQKQLRNLADVTTAPFTEEDADAVYKDIISRSEKNMQRIQSMLADAIKSIPWHGSVVSIKVDDPYNDIIKDRTYSEPVDGGQVFVGPKASFSLWADDNQVIVDDVLDYGDVDDWFQSQQQENDYFSLVHRLKNGGKDDDKYLTLYTARPVADRDRYMDATDVPAGIYLTSKYDSAEGIGIDFGQRDIYRLRIQKKYLIQTLEGHEQQYQVRPISGMDVIPVKNMQYLSTV